MAVQEHDYFSFSAGNGVSGVSRPQTSVKPKQEAARSGGGIKPFVQGIILGTVLLIPAGVWYWIRLAPEEAVAEETAPARPAKANKAAAAYGYKRKPVKVVKAPVPLKNEESNQQTGSLVVTEPPPVVVAAPVPSASPLVQIPKVPSESESLVPDKPKKNIWHKLASPFRGKSPNSNEPPAPDGGQ